MKKYTLLLDESGNFKETAQKAGPSIVAGLLAEEGIFSEAWARGCFKALQERDKNYESIIINPFHAMEEKSPYKSDYITDLLCALAKKGVRIVSFVNQNGIVIVNSDITYLNVFANGVISLVRTLLKTTDEDISLDIFYAHREEDVLRENHNLHVRIQQEEYEKRLLERLELLVAKMPVTDRKRIGRRITLRTDNAKKNPLLMLADAVCFALRGGKGCFGKEQKARIQELDPLVYEVPEKETWSVLQDSMMHNHYAEAVFLWYGGFQEELGKYRDTFHEQLVRHFLDAEEAEREVETTILSQYLQRLIKQRLFDVANRYMEGMDNEFIPLMRGHGIHFDRLYFDLHYSRLTTATHQGDCITGEKEIALCRDSLKAVPLTCETLDYYLRYKIREVEHLKNCYDFKTALRELDNLEKILTNMVELIQMIDELGDWAKGITSNTLGRIYGSRIMTRCYLSLSMKEQFELARADFEKALEQFSNDSDQRRDCQSRAAVEYTAGHYEEALGFLSLAFMDDESTDVRKVLNAILNEKRGNNRLFGLMHYATEMARAMLDGNSLGTEMFEAWMAKDIDFGTGKDEYPVSVILWRLATCAALQNLRAAKGWYKRAIDASMRNVHAHTNVIIGLTIQLERLALLPFNTEKNIIRLQKDYREFMASGIPAALRGSLELWEERIAAIDKENIETQKKDILLCVKNTPIL